LWPKSGANPWQHLFFLNNIQKVHLIKKEVLRDAEYNDPKDVLSGIRPVTGQRLESLLRGANSLRQRLGLPEPLDLESQELSEELGLLVDEDSDALLDRLI
jgi:hypothetical protein